MLVTTLSQIINIFRNERHHKTLRSEEITDDSNFGWCSGYTRGFVDGDIRETIIGCDGLQTGDNVRIEWECAIDIGKWSWIQIFRYFAGYTVKKKVTINQEYIGDVIFPECPEIIKRDDFNNTIKHIKF